MALKENINPNTNYDLHHKHKKVRTKSKSNVDPMIENSINYGRGSKTGNSINILYSK